MDVNISETLVQVYHASKSVLRDTGESDWTRDIFGLHEQRSCFKVLFVGVALGT